MDQLLLCLQTEALDNWSLSVQTIPGRVQCCDHSISGRTFDAMVELRDFPVDSLLRLADRFDDVDLLSCVIDLVPTAQCEVFAPFVPNYWDRFHQDISYYMWGENTHRLAASFANKWGLNIYAKWQLFDKLEALIQAPINLYQAKQCLFHGDSPAMREWLLSKQIDFIDEHLEFLPNVSALRWLIDRGVPYESLSDADRLLLGDARPLSREQTYSITIEVSYLIHDWNSYRFPSYRESQQEAIESLWSIIDLRKLYIGMIDLDIVKWIIQISSPEQLERLQHKPIYSADLDLHDYLQELGLNSVFEPYEELLPETWVAPAEKLGLYALLPYPTAWLDQYGQTLVDVRFNWDNYLVLPSIRLVYWMDANNKTLPKRLELCGIWFTKSQAAWLNRRYKPVLDTTAYRFQLR